MFNNTKNNDNDDKSNYNDNSTNNNNNNNNNMPVKVAQGRTPFLGPAPQQLGMAGKSSRRHIWIFGRGGCSGRGVQWMGVVLYNKLVCNIM